MTGCVGWWVLAMLSGSEGIKVWGWAVVADAGVVIAGADMAEAGAGMTECRKKCAEVTELELNWKLSHELLFHFWADVKCKKIRSTY